MEIPSIKDHLLNECDKKAELKQCSRCKQMIHQSVYEEHTQLQACKANPEDASLCPLCETDITKLTKTNNLQEAWLTHLVQDKCPKNPKKG